jgi:hypothetical protein
VESSGECGNEPSGPLKCWETIEWPNICDLSSSSQLHELVYLLLRAKLGLG